VLASMESQMTTYAMPSRMCLGACRPTLKTDFTMLIGPDQASNLLEIGIVATDEIEYVIHAMRARPQYLTMIRRSEL
jgi:hypothetical protein